ncbi:MAG: hypothetical protein WAZ17_01940, partial [Thermovirgaceae bacterium]
HPGSLLKITKRLAPSYEGASLARGATLLFGLFGLLSRFETVYPLIAFFKDFLRGSVQGLYSVGLGEERFQRFASPLCRRAHNLLFPVITA